MEIKKCAVMVIVVSLLTVSCAGKGGVSALPSTHSGPAVNAMVGTTPQNFGMGLSVAPTLAAAPSGWANTATQAIGPKLASATEIGALPATTPLTVRLGLQMRSPAQLTALIAAHQTLSNGAFMASYAPTPAQTSAVTAYLQSSGFTNITVEPNNLLVSANGTAAQVNAAFDTSLLNYTQNGQTVYANATPALVPTALGGIVISVLGINNALVMQTTAPQAITPCLAPTPGGVPCPRFYTPSTYWATYDVGATPTGGETNIAVMTATDVTPSLINLRSDEGLFGLRQVPYHVIYVGPRTPASVADNGEWSLDFDYTTGMAGDVHLLNIYQTASLSDSDITLEFNKWVADDKAPIANASFGECEFQSYLDASLQTNDEILALGAAQGQTLSAAAGDGGSNCAVIIGANGAPVGAPDVSYPCSSPYDLCTGGTDLYSNTDGSYLGETCWESGGGGQSEFEYQPPWEAAAQPQSTVAGNIGLLRGVPDIAMDASLETGAYVGGDTPLYATGGTSLASPLSVGTWARLESAHANRLGFAPPLLYQDYADNPTAGAISVGPPATEPRGGFHDLLNGGNGYYTALPGYDFCSGLGSYDVSVMNGLIGADLQKI